MRTRLIVNPFAGQGRPRKNLTQVRRLLRDYGFKIETVVTHRVGQATALAHEAARLGYNCVIVGAGDGTINEAVNGLAGTDVPLGVIPLGTGNVLANNIGVPLSIEGACEVIARGAIRKVDLGKANGRYFLLMAGIGFDAQVVQEVHPQLKSLLRGFAYVLSTFNNVFRYQSSRMRITLDGNQEMSLPAWLVMVGNVASYAWNIKVTSLARLDDGYLDVCIFPHHGRLAGVRQAIRTLVGQHIAYQEVEYHRAKRIHIVSTPPVPVQLDGDALTATPVDIQVVHKALNVFVPKEMEKERRRLP
jgi:YegS/Rv2252/BmrU family lipid kinase